MIGVASTAPNWPGLVIVKVPPCDVVGDQPPVARAGGDVGDRRGQPLEAEPLGLADHRDDQPLLERDCDPEVDVVVVDDLVALDRGVEDGCSSSAITVARATKAR